MIVKILEKVHVYEIILQYTLQEYVEIIESLMWCHYISTPFKKWIPKFEIMKFLFKLQDKNVFVYFSGSRNAFGDKTNFTTNIIELKFEDEHNVLLKVDNSNNLYNEFSKIAISKTFNNLTIKSIDFFRSLESLFEKNIKIHII